VIHEYGDQNRCFDDPPRAVVDYLPASVGRDERERIQTNSPEIKELIKFEQTRKKDLIKIPLVNVHGSNIWLTVQKLKDALAKIRFTRTLN